MTNRITSTKMEKYNLTTSQEREREKKKERERKREKEKKKEIERKKKKLYGKLTKADYCTLLGAILFY